MHVQEDQDAVLRALLKQQIHNLPRRQVVVLGRDLLPVRVLQLPEPRVVLVHGREREGEGEGQADGVELVLEEEVDHLFCKVGVGVGAGGGGGGGAMCIWILP